MSAPKQCDRCTEAGLSGQMISFKQDGRKADGSARWIPINADGSNHEHKTKAETPKQEPLSPE